jgi:hypothetical protein
MKHKMIGSKRRCGNLRGYNADRVTHKAVSDVTIVQAGSITDGCVQATEEKLYETTLSHDVAAGVY